MSASPEEKINLTRDLPEYPELYEGVPQSNTARQYSKRLMKKIRLGQKLTTEDWQWKNIYDRIVKNAVSEEEEELEENGDKKDAYSLLIDKIASLTENYEKRLLKLHEHYQIQLKEKDKRIDDILADHNKQRDSDFTKLVGMVATAGKDGAENANKHLTTALEKTNSLNGTLLSTMQTQWQNVGTIGKKHYEELIKILDAKEKEEPGFWSDFFEEVVLPNKDKIGNGIKGLLETYLPKH